MNPIAEEAFSWLNTPHVNQAKVKGRGVDCGMLLIACLEGANVIKEGSIQIPPYSNEWHLHHSEEWFLHTVEKYCDKIPLSDIQPGDFLLYQYGRCVSHGGVYVGDNHIIHATIRNGTIMSDLNDVIFLDKHGQSRLRGAYRFRKGKAL